METVNKAKAYLYMVLEVALGLIQREHQCVFHHLPHLTAPLDSTVYLTNI